VPPVNILELYPGGLWRTLLTDTYLTNAKGGGGWVVSEEQFRAYFSENFGVIFKEAFINIFQGVKRHTMGNPREGAAYFKMGVRGLLKIQTNLEAVFGSRGV
jgi:hypothetical protein